MQERADIPKPTREDFAGAREELHEALIGRGAVEEPVGGEEGGFNVTNPMMAAAKGSLGATAGLLARRVAGVPQDPFAPPSGSRAPSPDSLKCTEHHPGTP